YAHRPHSRSTLFPYTTLFRSRHTEMQTASDAATRLAILLRAHLGSRVLGPEPPMISRIRNHFIQTVTLKIERNNVSITRVKELINQAITQVGMEKQYKGARISIDVDPYCSLRALHCVANDFSASFGNSRCLPQVFLKKFCRKKFFVFPLKKSISPRRWTAYVNPFHARLSTPGAKPCATASRRLSRSIF